MFISKIILFVYISYILCQREKLQIVNLLNPNFSPEETKNLIFAFNNMKHGATTPCYGLNEYYTDIFGQRWEGYCELTKKGYLQLFKLGKIWQQRYSRLLNLSNPDVNKVKSFASQANKTLMSSNALFYGIYINKSTAIEEQLTVPVRNFKNYEGEELIPIFYYGDKNNCKGWKKIVENNMNKLTAEINRNLNKFYNNYKNIFNAVKKDERMINSKTLLEKIDLICSSYVSNYYDDRHRNIRLFKTLNYTDEKFYNLYYDCIEINLFRYINIDYGEDAQKVPTIILSDLVKDMIYYMDEIIKNPESAKFISYIGHDSTIAGLQVILEKAFNVSPKLMNFASNQLFLLYKISDNKTEIEQNYEVKYFYNDQLSMITDYAEFKKTLLKFLNTQNNLQFFCEGLKPYDFIVLSLSSAIIILLFGIISICIYHRNLLFNKKVYLSLKEESKEKVVDIKN